MCVSDDPDPFRMAVAQNLVSSCSVSLLSCSCHVDLHLVWRCYLSLAGGDSLGLLLHVARQAIHLLRQSCQGRRFVNFVGHRGCLPMPQAIYPSNSILVCCLLFLSDLHLFTSICLCPCISVTLPLSASFAVGAGFPVFALLLL